jgi:hypothetical protein
MPIALTTDGFLGFHDYNAPDGAPGAYWSGHGDIVSNALKQSGTAHQIGRRVDIADRSEIWRQVKLRTNSYGGLTLRHKPDGQCWFLMTFIGDGSMQIHRREADGAYTLVASGIGGVGGAIPYQVNVWQTWQMDAKDGRLRLLTPGNLAGDNVGYSAAHAHMDGASGTAGLHHHYAFGAAAGVEIDDDLLCMKPEIVMNELPTGHKMRIGSAVAVESGGTATLDAHALITLWPVAAVELLDASNVVVESYTVPASDGRPAGVLPGDVYVYSAGGGAASSSRSGVRAFGYTGSLIRSYR